MHEDLLQPDLYYRLGDPRFDAGTDRYLLSDPCLMVENGRTVFEEGCLAFEHLFEIEREN